VKAELDKVWLWRLYRLHSSGYSGASPVLKSVKDSSFAAEADVRWRKAILHWCGPNAFWEWTKDGSCTVNGVMVFLPS